MKILVSYRAIHNTAGGVERISTWLMNELVKHGHEVKFVTLDDNKAISFYDMHPAITWQKLGIGDPSLSAAFITRLKRIVAIRQIIKTFKPDVAIGFQEASYLSTKLASIGTNVPVIAAERNAPSRFKYMRTSKAALAFTSFFFADFVTIQLSSFRQGYPSWLHRKIRVIPNPVFPVERKQSDKENIILSIGRLEYQKNFQCLVKAFAEIAERVSDWKLVIVGEGNDRVELETIIRDNNLQNRIRLPGATSEVSSYFNQAKIFCLPSRWEGFPNALSEALSYGIASTGFAGCDGVGDLIIHEHNGLLIDGNGDVQGLAAALSRLIEQNKSRDEMGANAINCVKAYDPSSIFRQWEQLFKDAVSRKT